jgi:hypothetical protein
MGLDDRFPEPPPDLSLGKGEAAEFTYYILQGDLGNALYYEH